METTSMTVSSEEAEPAAEMLMYFTGFASAGSDRFAIS